MIDCLAAYGIAQDKIVWFDCESFEEPDAYISVFDSLVSITEGKFKPENVSWESYHSFHTAPDVQEHFIALVSLTCKDRNFMFKVLCEGWFDEGLISGLNYILDALQETEARFCAITTGDQSMIVVFVDRAVYNQLEDAGLVDHEYKLEKPTNWN